MNLKLQRHQQFGFTLVEIAIVLVIIGLLITGLLTPLTAQYDLKSYSETRERIANIKEAVTGFALVNGRLPCPAIGTVASGSVGAGLEVCTLTSTTGVVPWATLGLPETDAWNRRFTYQVTQSFTDATPDACAFGTTSSFALCSQGDISINNGAVTIATGIPVLVVSHGKNGFGAYLPSGLRVPYTSETTLEEQNNANASYPPVYVSMTPTAQGFDDVVDWVSHNVLFNRMVTAGRLP